jgi:hypothetical protein
MSGTEGLALTSNGPNPAGFQQQVAGSGLTPVHYFLSSEGTIAAPTITQANGIVGSIKGAGYDGAAFRDATGIFMIAENPSAGFMPGTLQFHTGGTIGSLTNRMAIDSAGLVSVESLTANSFLYSGTSKRLTTTATPTDGQLLIGDTGGPPLAGTITAGTGITITNGPGTITIAASGGGTAPIIQPSSKVAVTANAVFPNTHVLAGSGWNRFDGLGVADATTLTTDGIWALLFPMPPALPTGTATLRTRCIANQTSGVLRYNAKWASCAVEEDCSGLTLNAEGDTDITWAGGDADVFKESDVTLNADTVVAGENIVMNWTAVDTGTTSAVTMTCSVYIVFLP